MTVAPCGGNQTYLKGSMRDYERENLEFQITSSENNLRYLAGEPDSERKTRCIRINEEGIAKCKARLKEMDEARKATK